MKFKLAAILTAVVVLAISSHAGASTLVLGPNFQDGPLSVSLDGGASFFQTSSGSIWPSSLDSVSIPYVYCVEITTHVDVPGTYDSTVSSTGYVHGGLIANAGQIAWLMDNVAPLAISQDQQEGLQAAIWQQVFGASFAVDPANTGAGIYANYLADLAALGVQTSPVSDVLWMSPYYPDGSNAQGLITSAPPINVPEPSSFVLFGLGLFTLIGYRLRRRFA